MKSWLTGWCSNGPDGNHHLCRQYYTAGAQERQYVCTCECHRPTWRSGVVKRTLKRKETGYGNEV